MAEIDLDTLTSDDLLAFIKSSRSRFDDALRLSHSECIDGMNAGDMGSNHRLACIKRIPGLVLPTGVVVCEKSSKTRPKNTSRFGIPLSRGVVHAAINCVTQKTDRVYKLTRAGSSDSGVMESSPRLVDTEDAKVRHVIIGVTWTLRKADRSMLFVVRLLGGRLDHESGLFYAEIDEVIAIIDTRDGGEPVVTNVEPVGPAPILSRKSETNAP